MTGALVGQIQRARQREGIVTHVARIALRLVLAESCDNNACASSDDPLQGCVRMHVGAGIKGVWGAPSRSSQCGIAFSNTDPRGVHMRPPKQFVVDPAVTSELDGRQVVRRLVTIPQHNRCPGYRMGVSEKKEPPQVPP